jgi:hypothetical protein
MLHHKYIEVREVSGKGMGCFAKCKIGANFAVEKAHVIIVPSDTLCDELAAYAFDWSSNEAAIALGMGGIFNHSQNPNVDYHMENGCIYFITQKPVAKGDELTINYGEDYVDSCPTNLRKKLLTSKIVEPLRNEAIKVTISQAVLGQAKTVRFHKL